MNVKIKSKKYKTNILFSTLKKAGLNIKRTTILLDTKEDIEIFLAIISRFFFTNIFLQFSKDIDLTPAATNILRKNFAPLIYIRDKLLNYLRCGNNLINIEEFITYNLTEVSNKFEEELIKFNVNSIRQEIDTMLLPKSKKNILNKITFNFIYCFDIKRFYATILDSKGNVIYEITNSNYKKMISFLKTNSDVKEIKITGLYNMNVVNNLYSLLIEEGFYKINFNFVRKEGVRE